MPDLGVCLIRASLSVSQGGCLQQLPTLPGAAHECRFSAVKAEKTLDQWICTS